MLKEVEETERKEVRKIRRKDKRKDRYYSNVNDQESRECITLIIKKIEI